MRQREEIERHVRPVNRAVAGGFRLSREVRGLSNEVRTTLERQRPETLGQASRLSGVTPAAISLLLVHFKRGRGGNGKTVQSA